MNVEVRKVGANPSETESELRTLFHRLNNQLGVILAQAEMQESKATNDIDRLRASQAVTSVLDAMGTAKDIRRLSEPQGTV